MSRVRGLAPASSGSAVLLASQLCSCPQRADLNQRFSSATAADRLVNRAVK